MATPTPSEAERYRYLKLKQKQAMAQQQPEQQQEQPQEQQTQQPTGQITGQDIQEHPIKSLLRAATQPVTQSVAGTTLGQQYDKNLAATPFAMMDSIGQGKNPLAQASAFGESFMGGMAADVADMAQTPGNYLLTGLVGKVGGAVKSVMKFDNALKQAGKAQQGLDALQGILGKAKELAIREVKDIPAQINFGKNNVPKIIEHIKNPMYEVEFTPTGDVVRTVGNLDKIKMAVDDMIHSPKVWDEATTMEQRYIKMFRNEIKKSMIDASKSVGKDIEPALNSYSEFKENAYLIKKSIQDTAGNAQANKLKAAFKIGAEPATKEAWKEVSKISPEVKQVMGSMNRRELIKNLLKYSAYVGVGGGTLGGIKKLVGN